LKDERAELPMHVETVEEGDEATEEEVESVDEATARAERSTKAVKSNDAEIPMHLWDKQILLSMDRMEVPEEEVQEALATLRQLMLRY
jgi:hypothetical protein